MSTGRLGAGDSAIQSTIVDAKGDLLTATAADTPARLAVGANETRLVAASGEATGLKYVADTTNYAIAAKGDLLVGSAADTLSALSVGTNGDTLVADSAASTGLRWQGNFAAGKNKVINGDFSINQRNFTSTTTSQTFGFDRWININAGGTTTYSAETFTPGTAPVAGYEGKNFARLVSTGQTATSSQSRLLHRIESARTFANQTITISFWAKAASGTPNVAVEVQQDFGTGGSGSPSSLVNTYVNQVTLSTAWTRYSLTVNVPSVAGKTFATENIDYFGLVLWTSAGSDFNARTGSLGIQSNTFDFWGVQVEAGSVATAFQTATGTLSGELAACYRYYQRFNGGLGMPYSAYASGTTLMFGTFATMMPMRVAPSVSVSGTLYAFTSAAESNTASPTVDFSDPYVGGGRLRIGGWTGLTDGRLMNFYYNTGFVALSSEL